MSIDKSMDEAQDITNKPASMVFAISSTLSREGRAIISSTTLTPKRGARRGRMQRPKALSALLSRMVSRGLGNTVSVCMNLR